MLDKRRRVIQVQLAFVVTVMEPLYKAIVVVQKESGGILDVLGIFRGCVILRGG
jgi:hypothetical protein